MKEFLQLTPAAAGNLTETHFDIGRIIVESRVRRCDEALSGVRAERNARPKTCRRAEVAFTDLDRYSVSEPYFGLFCRTKRGEGVDRCRQREAFPDGCRLFGVNRSLAADRRPDREVLLDRNAGIVGIGVYDDFLIPWDFNGSG